MSHENCPDLETLFLDVAEEHGAALEHLERCERCAALLEEHRQIEKDLYRLADPLPPPDFVNQVMAKVAAAPRASRQELSTGLSILGGALLLGTLALALSGRVGGLPVRFADTLVRTQELGRAGLTSLSALWSTAAGPFALGLAILLVFSVVGLRRLIGPAASPVRVTP